MNAPRIPIQLTIILNKTGETVRTSTFWKRSNLRAIAPIVFSEYDASEHTFECTFMYSKSKGSINTFQFKNMAELNKNIQACTESELIDFLIEGDMIDKSCFQITTRTKKATIRTKRKK